MSKKEELNEVYFEAGVGLFDSQTLEYSFSYLIYLLSTLGFADIDPEKAVAIIDGRKKQTIGQLFKFLKEKGVTFSLGLENDLQDAVAARNQFIHHYLIDNMERLANPKTRTDVVKEIRRLRKRMQKGDKALRNFLDGLSELSTGISPQIMKESLLKEFGLEHWERKTNKSV